MCTNLLNSYHDFDNYESDKNFDNDSNNDNADDNNSNNNNNNKKQQLGKTAHEQEVLDSIPARVNNYFPYVQ